MAREAFALPDVPPTAAAGVDRLLELAVDTVFFGRSDLDPDDVAEALAARVHVHVRRIVHGLAPIAA